MSSFPGSGAAKARKIPQVSIQKAVVISLHQSRAKSRLDDEEIQTGVFERGTANS